MKEQKKTEKSVSKAKIKVVFDSLKTSVKKDAHAIGCQIEAVFS